MIDTVESPYIQAAGAENFKSLVVENSYQGPVLVNFWSRKDGPCLRQYPLLDKIIHHYDGRVLLINIDADAEVAITRKYGVNSVPTLRLFRRGEVVESRHGFQSEQELYKLLEPYVARDSDLVLADAIDLYARGERVEAYEKIANAIVDDPVNPRLPLTMCKLLKHEARYAEALKLIQSLPQGIRDNHEISQLRDLLGFHLDIVPENSLESLEQQLKSTADDPVIRRQLIAHYVVQQQYEAALQQLVEIMEYDQGFYDSYAQKAMLRIFNIIGADDPLVSKYRPHLKRFAD